ncbi:heme biosynthesis HemY N-terminal domain-containing protein [Hydrogenovibrio sp. 3SP14C1]|uniref:heme biosynthesis HemY N-terminal domain-containing protein n=1 Tax=Hydrogenovibrio sp. 3SP14C1 TaxID=3038774 RepID=UPI0024178E08|nr:heme biosynthesis HemY N-terminal domain-containing protein [Hydrogenovibrio sp. 3SP14C1]MDG4813585.1 heme biosynthesis HemY N-terminal domain-containing protein [Hydrogenovibrio sp. 3SP14C1]
MSKILKWSLFLLIATGLTSLALYDNGQVSMVWNDWVIETSLSFALASIVVVFGSLYLFMRLLINLWHFPAYWRNRRQLKRYNKAETSISKGLIALEYGDWQLAEKQLIKMAKQSDAGLIHYLTAAKMAHNQGALARREQYLTEARKRFPQDYVTIGLVESRLLVEEQPDMALVILAELHEQNPKNRPILSEYVQLLEKQKHWHTLEGLLGQIKKIRALNRSSLQALEIRLIAGKVAKAENLDALDVLWKSLSAKQQLTPAILAEFVEQRMGWGKEQGLAELIVKSVSKQWDDRLVYQYGRIELGPAFERLKRAEKWLKGQDDNPVLLLTLGRLACMSQLWGQAKHFFQQSLKYQPELETFHALAKCYEAEGLETQAALTYKEAILQLEKKS